MSENFVLEHYTDSALYEMQLTVKYIKRMALNQFAQLGIEINPEEFLALDILLLNPEICQRDLAKKLLKDRAGMGRILTSLENAGLVERYADKKGKRPVLKAKITSKGRETIEMVTAKILPHIKRIKSHFSEQEEQELFDALRKIRKIISDNITTKI
jgi:DNA-binding MarR family transcriptional regulator